VKNEASIATLSASTATTKLLLAVNDTRQIMALLSFPLTSRPSHLNMRDGNNEAVVVTTKASGSIKHGVDVSTDARALRTVSPLNFDVNKASAVPTLAAATTTMQELSGCSNTNDRLLLNVPRKQRIQSPHQESLLVHLNKSVDKRYHTSQTFGHVQWFNKKRDYGVIRVDQSGETIFVHSTEVRQLVDSCCRKQINFAV
jgi:uncharacterized protein YlbG (UPF0298 family)